MHENLQDDIIHTEQTPIPVAKSTTKPVVVTPPLETIQLPTQQSDKELPNVYHQYKPTEYTQYHHYFYPQTNMDIPKLPYEHSEMHPYLKSVHNHQQYPDDPRFVQYPYQYSLPPPYIPGPLPQYQDPSFNVNHEIYANNLPNNYKPYAKYPRSYNQNYEGYNQNDENYKDNPYRNYENTNYDRNSNNSFGYRNRSYQGLRRYGNNKKYFDSGNFVGYFLKLKLETNLEIY